MDMAIASVTILIYSMNLLQQVLSMSMPRRAMMYIVREPTTNAWQNCWEPSELSAPEIAITQGDQGSREALEARAIAGISFLQSSCKSCKSDMSRSRLRASSFEHYNNFEFGGSDVNLKLCVFIIKHEIFIIEL